jgi:hypothetical protein
MAAADYIFCAAVFIVIASNLYFGPQIKGERIPMQWGLDGKPTWSAPKQIALWGMVAFMLAMRLLIWAAATYAPSRVHGVEIGIIGMSIIVVAAHLYTLMAAKKERAPLGPNE